MGAGYVTNQSTTLVIGSLTSLFFSLPLSFSLVEYRHSRILSFFFSLVLCPTFANVVISLFQISLSLSLPLPTSLVNHPRKKKRDRGGDPLSQPPVASPNFLPPTTRLSSSTLVEQNRGFCWARNSAAIREKADRWKRIGNNGAS